MSKDPIQSYIRVPGLARLITIFDGLICMPQGIAAPRQYISREIFPRYHVMCMPWYTRTSAPHENEIASLHLQLKVTVP